MGIVTKDGTPVPVVTKKQRIADLEAALDKIAAGGMTLEEVTLYAASFHRTDKRWRVAS